jgi:hypothetical protein
MPQSISNLVDIQRATSAMVSLYLSSPLDSQQLLRSAALSRALTRFLKSEICSLMAAPPCLMVAALPWNTALLTHYLQSESY